MRAKAKANPKGSRNQKGSNFTAPDACFELVPFICGSGVSA